MAFRVTQNKVKIRNVSDSTDDIIGLNYYMDTNGSVNQATLEGKITIVSTKTFELQHRCTTTRSTDGSGRSDSYGVGEIYSLVTITKSG